MMQALATVNWTNDAMFTARDRGMVRFRDGSAYRVKLYETGWAVLPSGSTPGQGWEGLDIWAARNILNSAGAVLA